jgi:cytochrome c oxidase assembly factor CtaG
VNGFAIEVIAPRSGIVKEAAPPRRFKFALGWLVGAILICKTEYAREDSGEETAEISMRPWLGGLPTGRLAVIGAAIVLALTPGIALAHGEGKPAPGPLTLLTGWEFDPFFVVAVGLVSWLYLQGVSQVNRAHPRAPFPRKRTIYFFLGIGTLVVAIMSPIAAYDGELFAVHMWQHMLITLVAAPLLLLGTPITLALRAASPGIRKGVLLPILHSRIVKVLSFPVLAWLFFAVTMWASHFSPLYNAALENMWLHRLEHGWYIAAALFFWWPVVAADPTPWRMNHPVRMLYVFLQMPQNSFLALAVYNSKTVMYPHYENLVRDWGPGALKDQQLAGISMWVVGDLLFLIALVFVAYGWVQHEEREGKRQDRLLARQKELARRASGEQLPGTGVG